MTYLEFKSDYIYLIEELMASTDAPIRKRAFLCNALADLEELHPEWAERVEDSLEKYHPHLAYVTEQI
jgi:hypothetical protein